MTKPTRHPYEVRLDKAAARLESAADSHGVDRRRAFEVARRLFQASDLCLADAWETVAKRLEQDEIFDLSRVD